MRIIDKIFADKKGSSVIYILLAVGILLLSGGGTKTHTEAVSIKNQAEVSADNIKSETEKILSLIEGVGDVSVMISYSSKNDSESLLSVDNSSEQKEVKSVLVVARGGENAAVKEKIVRAVKSALGVETHKIEVFERKEIQ